jgi:hypothetical protein
LRFVDGGQSLFFPSFLTTSSGSPIYALIQTFRKIFSYVH